MKTVHDEKGRFLGISRRNADGSDTFFGPGSNLWQDFLAWRSKLPPEEQAKFDLSDKPPEPPQIDADLESIKAILEKQDDQISAAERWAIVLKAMRRLVKKNAL